MHNLTKITLLSLLLFVGCQPKGVTFLDAIVISNITTIDAANGLKENQIVVIKNAKIFGIHASSDIQLSDNNEIIDGTGKFLIPGLWDAHVHFAFMENLAPSMFDLFLAYGVTSVRDTGGEVDFVKSWKDKALANPTDAPRVMMAGPLLDGMPNVYDGSDANHPPLSWGSASVEELNELMIRLKGLDVDLLKAYEMLTPEQFGAITAFARENNLRVTGHVPLSMDVISASNAGLNSMEHMRNLELSAASNANELWEERKKLLSEGKNKTGGDLRSSIHTAQRQRAIENYDEQKADEILAVLAKNETWQIPTLALNTGSTEQPFARADFQKSFDYLPAEVQENWKSSIELMSQREVTTFDKEYGDWKFNMVGKIHEAGIDIMAGTDCPIFFLTPGRSLHEELAVLVKAGVSPIEALKSATLNPARYFGLEKELGLIQETMWADLLILDANPLDDINNTLKINAVFKQGKHYDRSSLNELLNNLKPK